MSDRGSEAQPGTDGADPLATGRSGASPVALGRLVVLTDRHACAQQGRSLIDTIEQVVDAGVRVVLFREKDLARGERATLATALREIVPTLIVASDVALADATAADGVHLAADDPWPESSSGPASAPPRRAPHAGPRYSLTVGRSCHTETEVRMAGPAGATYVTLSPIFLTPSKPGYGPALGPAVLAADPPAGPGQRPVAVYALGGVTADNARSCVDAGATGVAVMGAVMSARRPGAVIRQLLDALDA